jgi:hypothetical protein
VLYDVYYRDGTRDVNAPWTYLHSLRLEARTRKTLVGIHATRKEEDGRETRNLVLAEGPDGPYWGDWVNRRVFVGQDAPPPRPAPAVKRWNLIDPAAENILSRDGGWLPLSTGCDLRIAAFETRADAETAQRLLLCLGVQSQVDSLLWPE